MHDIMVVTQELEFEKVEKSKQCTSSAPPKAPSAVAEKVALDDAVVVVDDASIDDEAIAALRWASNLTEDANVINLIHSLPQGIVLEQSFWVVSEID